MRRFDLSFLLKVSRPGFWTTSIWFYLLAAGQGARLDQFGFWLGLLYVTWPLGSFIYGWNDIADRDEDVHNPRKDTYLFGARASREQLRRLPMVLLCTQLPFVILFFVLFGAKVLLWFAALVLATAVYNLPGLAFRRRPGLDLLNQSGYLLVFVLSSWLNEAPQLPWQTFVWGGLFAMHAHLMGAIMDLPTDRATGRHTTAVCLGARRAKVLIASLLLLEALWVGYYFRDLIVTGFLAASLAWCLLDLVVLVQERPYTMPQMRRILLGWNVVAAGSMVWVWHASPLTQLAVTVAH
jgi:4-hydroxybenzoate polyprenyltransferase